MPGGFVTLVGMDLLGLVGTHCHILNHVNYSRKEVQPCCWQSLSGYFVVQHYCSCTTPTVRASKELGHSEYVRKYRYIPTIFVEVSVSLPGRWVILIHSHSRTLLPQIPILVTRGSFLALVCTYVYVPYSVVLCSNTGYIRADRSCGEHTYVYRTIPFKFKFKCVRTYRILRSNSNTVV